jgi:predicted metalloprotease with PDZ domain
MWSQEDVVKQRWTWVWLLGLPLCAFAETPRATGAAEAVEVQVDARELPRKLVEARARFRVQPGRRSFYYPRWMPGTHAPMGPVQNLAGLIFETTEGKPLAWVRDETDPYRFSCDVPPGQSHLVVRTRYICNQQTVNSDGADCFGNALLGVLNWNTLLLYPEGKPVAALPVRLELRLPEGWRLATALKVREHDAAAVRFETVDFETLVDSPLVAGKFLRSIPLKAPNVSVPHSLEVVSESEAALQLPEELIARLGRVVGEAFALFGRHPYPAYSFLLTLSDAIGFTGLEHLSSSLNGLKERDLADVEKIAPWSAYLLPHEFAHAWCGKWRRPQGMVTPDFHTPERTELLWIYEGLTQYLGNVLSTRAGLVKPEDYKASLVHSLGWLIHTKGRRWRTLEDTASSSYLIRAPSPSWSLYRRDQDYYVEGELVWMEADALIRKETDGARSLDDFCRRFFGAERAGAGVHPYTLEEVTGAMSAVHPHDWKAFFAERVQRTQKELPLEFLTLLGYRLQYGAQRSKLLKEAEERWHFRDFSDSLGLVVAEDGRVTRVVPEKPADRAGLYEGVQVLGVGGRKFSLQRMEDGVAGSVASRSVKLLVLQGDVLRDLELDYGDGSKYLELARDEGQPDRLGALIQPLVKAENPAAPAP